MKARLAMLVVCLALVVAPAAARDNDKTCSTVVCLGTSLLTTPEWCKNGGPGFFDCFVAGVFYAAGSTITTYSGVGLPGVVHATLDMVDCSWSTDELVPRHGTCLPANTHDSRQATWDGVTSAAKITRAVVSTGHFNVPTGRFVCTQILVQFRAQGAAATPTDEVAIDRISSDDLIGRGLTICVD